MNIAYLTDTFLPDVSGGAIRAFHQAEFLHNQGYEVTVFTNVKAEKFPWKMVKCNGKSLWQVFPNAGYIPSYVKNVKRLHMQKKFDIMFVSMPSFAIGASALWLEKALKVPFIIEVRDPFVRPMEIGKKDAAYISKKSWKGKILFKLQGKIFKHAKKIIVTNPSIKEEIMEMHNIGEDKISVIYNSPSIEQFKQAQAKSFPTFTILYAGRILPSKSLQDVLMALKDFDGKLMVCGEGNPEFLAKIAERENLHGKFEFIGRLSHTDTLNYLLGANILYVGLDDSPAVEYALPSKVFEYMAAGKPILSIGSKTGDLCKILTETKAGIHTSKNREDVIRALQELKEKHEFFSKNGLKAVETEYNTTIQLKKMFTIINEVEKK